MTILTALSFAGKVARISNYGFGKLDDETKELLITFNADAIIAIALLKRIQPSNYRPRSGYQALIEQYQEGLKKLGVENPDEVIGTALSRFEKLDSHSQAIWLSKFLE